MKDNKKGFFKYISSKWTTRENMGQILNEVGVLVLEDTEKTELLNTAFASVFLAKAGPQKSQALKVREEAFQKKTFPWSRRIGLEIIKANRAPTNP